MGNGYNFDELKSTNQSFNPSVMNEIIVAGRNAGLSDNHIAVLLANSMYESGHNPSANNGTYQGLFQWHKNQASNFKLGDTNSQINYILKDIGRGKWPQKGDTWNGWNPKHYKVWIDPKSTIDQLNDAFELGYERRGQTSIDRRNAARIILKILQPGR